MASEQKTKAVAYLRTNKSEVGDQLFDLHTQHKDVIEFADVNAITVVKSFDDFGDNKHSKLYDVLGYCRSNEHIKMVVAKTQTRISRDIKEFKDWESIFEAIGVELKFTQQSVMGDIVDQVLQQVMVQFGEQEASSRAAYIKRGLLARVQAGYSVQKPPLGYIKSDTRGVYVPTNTATFLKCEISKFLDGKQSAQDLRSKVSHIYSVDKSLSSSRFKQIITNPYYAGYVRYGDKLYKGLHEPLLTVAEYEKLTTLLGK